MAQIDFGGFIEEVVTRDEFPLEKAREVLHDETVAILGYGVQGPGQAMNMKDNGINVIVGQRQPSKSWDKAVADGWIPGENLFSLEEAAEKGTILFYLLSDAGQTLMWDKIKPYLRAGNTLYFSHGFSIAYKDRTGVVPPDDIDVILVAPKGPGRMLRELFLKGKGVNSSYAVFQDATGRAEDRVKALGMAVGSGFLFPTTFEKEVYSDLTGERGVLMGAIAGLMEAQYAVLRRNGHTPSEAFNETVEEATQSLYPMIGEKGMDWMFANCSTTAQRGALDWKNRFRDAVSPIFDSLYERVKSGEEAQISLDSNSQPDYRKKLQVELDKMKSSEMWRVGAAVRKLRP